MNEKTNNIDINSRNKNNNVIYKDINYIDINILEALNHKKNDLYSNYKHNKNINQNKKMPTTLKINSNFDMNCYNINIQQSQIDANISNHTHKNTRNNNTNNYQVQKYNSMRNFRNNNQRKKMSSKTKLDLLKYEINELYNKMQMSNDIINNNINQRKQIEKNNFSKTYTNFNGNNIFYS